MTNVSVIDAWFAAIRALAEYLGAYRITMDKGAGDVTFVVDEGEGYDSTFTLYIQDVMSVAWVATHTTADADSIFAAFDHAEARILKPPLTPQGDGRHAMDG